MQVTINLTPILVVLIICVFLYAMCKMAREDKAKEEKKEIKVLEFTNHKSKVQPIHDVGCTQEQSET